MSSSAIGKAALMMVALFLLASCSKGGQSGARRAKAPKPAASTQQQSPADKKQDPADPPYNNDVTRPGHS